MKKLYSIKHKYIGVRSDAPECKQSVSFGGSQLYFNNIKQPLDKYRASSGCGIVALTDVLSYLRGQRSYSSPEAYRRAFNRAALLAGWIPIKCGLSFVHQTIGLFIQLRVYRLPYINHWCYSRKKLFGRVADMLQNDMPVILCIPKAQGRKASRDLLPLYNENAVRTNGTNGHFVVITGIYQDETTSKIYFEVSSWGQRFFIEYSEYLHYQKTHLNGIFGNIMYLRRL